MIVPKMQNRFCPKCKKHTQMELKRMSSGKKRRENARGQRRFRRKLQGYGSFPKSNPKGRAKPTKKVDLRYKCKECGKSFVIGKGFRAKKYEIVKK